MFTVVMSGTFAVLLSMHITGDRTATGGAPLTFVLVLLVLGIVANNYAVMRSCIPSARVIRMTVAIFSWHWDTDPNIQFRIVAP